MHDSDRCPLETSSASTYNAKKAAILNPDLAINPAATSFGTRNAILTGTSRRYFVPDFSGPLSVKATLQGISTWKVSGRDFRVSESAFLVVNSGQPYTIAYDGPEEVTTFCLLFQTGFVERLATAMDLSTARSLEDPFRTDSKEFRTALQPEPNKLLKHLRRFAIWLAMQTMAEETWELSFYEFAIALLRDTRNASPTAERIGAIKCATREELLRRASVGRDFLLSMSDQPITVEDAARAACLSTFHFHRTFVQVFHISPHQFLRNFRMLRAEQMLRSTSLPVIEIAHRVGFVSVGSFGSTFAKTRGLAPTSYRLLKSSGMIGHSDQSLIARDRTAHPNKRAHRRVERK
jgi:AraC family transcriptional regulator